MADMSVRLIVDLDFIVEDFDWKTVLTASCAGYLHDIPFMSALLGLSRATIVQLCISKWPGRGTED